MTNIIDWLHSLRPGILEFLSKLRHPEHPGFYSYSLSGDIFDHRITRWGLGNTVFAAKTYYMLDVLDSANLQEMAAFIKSFQIEDGHIFDPLVQKRSRARRYFNAIRNRDFNNFWGRQTRLAETRQAFAALRCLGFRPNDPYLHIPYTKSGIVRYIHSLNWRLPWGAGSHFSHLIFFLRNNFKLFHIHAEDIEELLEFAFKEVNQYRQRDGTWCEPGISLPDFQKVNGAMKMMIAYDVAEKDDFDNPESLIDLCLSVINDGNACNNFNIICVLYNCFKRTAYRKDEVINFCLSRLEIYKKYWWPEFGGCSFFPDRANKVYYGAKISKGLPEPDIHGTHLYLWGIVLISKILNLNNDLNFKVPIT
ncbi:hypothetical protein BMS3Abin10_01833 [bacterium BMS3Abin10]|nr:hypothetical protein BMS3Abin10_01833 [bacterium BMS3Abin10]GBE39933.1 hypothetical protein BMS3Bbin08_02567 [bacterium BMS3Bbin08]